MSNKGSTYLGILLFYVFLFIFFMFFGITVFQTIITGELNNIKNDMYLINRNVLMSLNHEFMGEDKVDVIPVIHPPGRYHQHTCQRR